MIELAVPENVGVALKALARGEARPDQQLISYRWITKELAGVDNVALAEPGPGETANWNSGRRWVGLQIQNIVATPLPTAEGTVNVGRLPAQARRRARRGE